MEEILKRIHEYSLEEIMGSRFARYSKYIIQDRAIPDVRDGLKPVQRRIIYAMYRDKNTYDKQFKKCANAVGNVLGKYHPHGDSSVYEALIRMSQSWKQNHILIEVDGNNGSIDGDGPAAYRYTECRLAKISEELLKDIDKDTVVMAPNYSDTLMEPTVLPAKFPNLLVNGTSGISAGYATNIPPHNLIEVCDAVIKRIDSPNCHEDSIFEIIKGPDFPTGAIVEGIDGIKEAFKKLNEKREEIRKQKEEEEKKIKVGDWVEVVNSGGGSYPGRTSFFNNPETQKYASHFRFGVVPENGTVGKVVYVDDTNFYLIQEEESPCYGEKGFSRLTYSKGIYLVSDRGIEKVAKPRA